MSRKGQQVDGQMDLFDFLPEEDIHTTLVRKNEYEMHHCKACGEMVPLREIYGTWPWQGIRLKERCPGCNRIIDYPQDLINIRDRVNNFCTNNVDKCNRTELWEKAKKDCPQTCCHKCQNKCKVKKELVCMWLRRDKVFDVDIRGIMDDAYCPACGYIFDEYKELDCKACPVCGLLVKWDRWHRHNDEYYKGGILSEKAKEGPLTDGG